MASVLSFLALSKFTFRVFKYNENRPDLPWVNNYEAYSRGEGVLANVQAMLVCLCLFEQVFHSTSTRIYKAIASTYDEEVSPPYNPDSFYTYLCDYQGARTVLNPVDTRVCWYVRKQVQSGRQGKLLYRGVLGEADIEAGAGTYALSDPSAMTTLLLNAEGAGLIEGGIVDADGGANFQLALMSNIVRDVTSLASTGVSIAKTNHRYFDRV